MFEGIQFHFHSPSEHTVDGKQYDLEMHIVHTQEGYSASSSDNNKLGVYGFFFDVSKGGDSENDFLKSFMYSDFPGNKDQTAVTYPKSSEDLNGDGQKDGSD